MLAGILAIGQAIEEIDESQVEAVRATGASGAQITTYGIVPQVLPAFAGISVFRWDINIRESTVLGLVDAGGSAYRSTLRSPCSPGPRCRSFC